MKGTCLLCGVAFKDGGIGAMAGISVVALISHHLLIRHANNERYLSSLINVIMGIETEPIVLIEEELMGIILLLLSLWGAMTVLAILSPFV